jgi:outer membrane biosynthesis protein TonB
MQTKSGNIFYLVIDYDKPIDEDAEMYETYFLNLVDERDLLSLMSEEEMPTATPQVIYVTPEPTTPPEPTPVPTTAPVETEKPEEKQEKNPMMGILAIVLILAVGGGAAFYFLKGKGKKTGNQAPSGYDFDDDEDEDEDEPEAESDSEK